MSEPMANATATDETTAPAPDAGGSAPAASGSAPTAEAVADPAPTNGATEPATEPAAETASKPVAEPVAARQLHIDLGELSEEDQKWAEKFPSGLSQLKSHRELERKIGASIRVPTDDSTEEEIAKFRRATGVPEEATGYEVDLGDMEINDDIQANLAAFQEAMHTSGASQPAVQTAVAYWHRMLAEGKKHHDEQLAAFHDKAEQELTREWGDDNTVNRTVVDRFVRQYDQDGRFLRFLQTPVAGGKLGDNPEMLRILARAGRGMLEGTAQLPPTEAETAVMDDDIARYGKLREDAGRRGDQTARVKYDELQRQAFGRKAGGAGPIVGEGGRTV